MLAGRSLFAGDTVTDTLAGVLKSEIDFDRAAGRRRRRRSAACCAAASSAIRRTACTTSPTRGSCSTRRSPAARRIPRRHPPPATGDRWLPWVVAAAGVATALLVLCSLRWVWRQAADGGARLTRTSILMPLAAKGDLRNGTFALSPDGGAIVLSAADEAGSRLFVRELAESEPRPLEGTEGATFPFWSADSQQHRLLRRRLAAPGAARRRCRADDLRRQGRPWRCLEPRRNDPLRGRFPGCAPLQVPASGGRARCRHDARRRAGGELASFPVVPARRPPLLCSVSSRGARATGYGSSWPPSTSCRRKGHLLEASAVPRFAYPNQLVFPRDTALMSQSIDLDRLEMVGEPKLLEERPSNLSGTSSVPFAEASAGGGECSTLGSIRGPPPSSGLTGTAGGARPPCGRTEVRVPGRLASRRSGRRDERGVRPRPTCGSSTSSTVMPHGSRP